jgi:hypothetical protein
MKDCVEGGRWERDVGKVMRGRGLNKFAYRDDVVKLLRQEHQAVIDMVQKDIRVYKKLVAETGVTRDEHTHAHAAWTALANLLTTLKERVK